MSGFRDQIDDALDALDSSGGSGSLELESDGNQATVDVLDTGRIGVRIKNVKVRRDQGRPIEETVDHYEKGLRALPERVVRNEVDPGLGGAILRTDPEDIVDDEFTQVDIRGEHDVEVNRYVRTPDGREATDFTVTRKQLGRLLDELV